MSISGILGNLNLKKISFQIASADEIYAGIETLVTIQVYNQRRWLRSFLLDISLLGNTESLLLLGQKEIKPVSIPVTFPARGIESSHRVEVRSTFPINFFIRSRTTEVDCEIVIFPHPKNCLSTAAQNTIHKGGEQETIFKGLEGDISRINDYRGGDPLKMIHWKLSARHDSLKTKELSATSQPPIEIEPLLLPGKTVEEQLCCASFLINEYIRQGHPVGLRLNDKVIPAAHDRPHKQRLLTELAYYDRH